MVEQSTKTICGGSETTTHSREWESGNGGDVAISIGETLFPKGEGGGRCCGWEGMRVGGAATGTGRVSVWWVRGRVCGRDVGLGDAQRGDMGNNRDACKVGG